MDDITAQALPATLMSVRAFTPRIINVTGDTYPEILNAADYGTSVLYLNNGVRDGTARFTDATAASNTSHETNGMGAATADDVNAYINAFLAAERRADLRPDGRVNFFDIAAYLDAYRSGCTPDTSRQSRAVTAHTSRTSRTVTRPAAQHAKPPAR